MTRYTLAAIILLNFLTLSCKQTPLKDSVANKEQITNTSSQFHNTALLQQETMPAKHISKKKLSCCKGAPSRFRQMVRTDKKM
jgi:hypothetical protein